jgi:hypothetical protein
MKLSWRMRAGESAADAVGRGGYLGAIPTCNSSGYQEMFGCARGWQRDAARPAGGDASAPSVSLRGWQRDAAKPAGGDASAPSVSLRGWQRDAAKPAGGTPAFRPFAAQFRSFALLRSFAKRTNGTLASSPAGLAASRCQPREHPKWHSLPPRYNPPPL